jgi:putative restriction endonuclease
MFDRGIISMQDDGELLVADGLVPEQLQQLLPRSRQIILPDKEILRPHPVFLRYHRENRFKG